MNDERDGLKLNVSCLVRERKLVLPDHTSSDRPVMATPAGSDLGAYSWKSTDVLCVMYAIYNANPAMTIATEPTTLRMIFLDSDFSPAIATIVPRRATLAPSGPVGASTRSLDYPPQDYPFSLNSIPSLPKHSQ